MVKKSDKIRNFLIASFLLSIPFVFDILTTCFFVKYHYWETKTCLYTIIKIVELVVICFVFNISFFACKRKNILITLWSIFAYIPSIINILSVCVSGNTLDNDFIAMVLNTNFKETAHFFQNYTIFIVSSLSVLFFVVYILKKIQTNTGNKKYDLSCLYVICAIVLLGTYTPICVIKTSIICHIDDILELRKFQKEHNCIQNINSNFKEQKQNYILVIGESVDRKHMQIYGYERETTPCFKSLEEELFIFKNVKTAHVFTSVAVKSMLRLKNNSKDEFFLIHFFQDAGFKTFWLSNQEQMHPFDNTLNRLGSLCNKSVFLNNLSHIEFLSKLTRSTHLDGDLLAYFRKALNDPADKKFIVLHLIGSHFPMNLRYPPEFNIFNLPENYHDRYKAKFVCDYDNSIRYTDHVLNEIINMLKKDNSSSCMVYLSDHGQDMYDTEECNISSRKTIHAYEIPFVVWLSDKYKEANQKFIKTWDLNRPFITDKTAYSLIDLARLSHDSIDLSESIFRPAD